METNKCEICGKESNFNGYVWLAEGKYTDLYLCRSHYLKWCKSPDTKKINEEYKDAKPTTKEWHKKFDKLQKTFDKWFPIQSKDEGVKDV